MARQFSSLADTDFSILATTFTGVAERNELFDPTGTFTAPFIIDARAGNDFVFGSEINDPLTSLGDVIAGGLGQDILEARGGNDLVHGDIESDLTQGGTDFILGGLGNDTVFGGGDKDFLNGEDGNDVLNGDDGDDTVWGGLGSDTLSGGAGNDYLAAGSDPSIGIGVGVSLVIVTDFDGTTGGQLTPPRSFTSQAGDDSVESFLDQGSVNILNGGAGNDTLLGAEGLDTLNGDENNDLLFGQAGEDVLNGGIGNDTLNGGTDVDTMAGGLGDDLYIVDRAGDAIIEATGEGIDTVQTSASYTLADNVENLVALGGNPLSLSGNDLANDIQGNGGANFIDGGNGSDTMRGEGGNDLYIVDVATDVIVELDGGGTDTVNTLVSFTLSDNAENLTAVGSEALLLVGNGLDNTITGNAANNIIDGGIGGDTMSGGAGADVYIVENALDVIVEDLSPSGGVDTVLISTSFVLQSGLENLTALGNVGLFLFGNTATNAISGTIGNDFIDGGVGADSMIGGAGNDTYRVDSSGDKVIETLGGGRDTILATASVKLSVSSDVEIVQAALSTSKSSFTFSGSKIANTLTGAAGHDTLLGFDGRDILNGNLGNDKLNGGLKADTLSGGQGRDIFVFDSPLSKTARDNIDTIKDFSTRDDTIQLQNSVFKALKKTGTLSASVFTVGSKATDDDHHVIYNKASGRVFYDADGVGGAAQIQIATLTNKASLAAADFVVI